MRWPSVWRQQADDIATACCSKRAVERDVRGYWPLRSAWRSASSDSPPMTASRVTSRQGWSQKWLHVSENPLFRADSSAHESLPGLPWAQGVAGSNPVAPTTFPICSRFDLAYFRHTDRWFTVYSGLTAAECFKEIEENEIFWPTT